MWDAARLASPASSPRTVTLTCMGATELPCTPVTRRARRLGHGMPISREVARDGSPSRTYPRPICRPIRAGSPGPAVVSQVFPLGRWTFGSGGPGRSAWVDGTIRRGSLCPERSRCGAAHSSGFGSTGIGDFPVASRKPPSVESRSQMSSIQASV